MKSTIKRKPFARQLEPVRKICLALPETTEKISHGEPTFFVKKRVYELDQVSDEALRAHIQQAWNQIASKGK
jgi:hypothetical protein